MKKSLITFIGFLGLLSIILIGCGSGEQNTNTDTNSNTNSPENEKKADAKTVRIGIGLSQEHPKYVALVQFKEEVEEKTNGAFDIQIHADGTLGDDRSMMEGLQMGTLEGTVPATSVVASFVPEFSVFDFPFLFPNLETVDKVLDGSIGEQMLEKLEDEQFVGLAFMELGFMDITNSKRPIEKVDDFKGLKIRTMENEVHLDTFRALGANPSPASFSELFTALQQGTFDGQVNPIATVYAQQFQEVQDYLTLTNHVYGPFVFMLSKHLWNELTEDEKEIFLQAAQNARDEQRKLMRESANEQLEELKEDGMNVNELDSKEIESIKELVQPVIKKYTDVVGEDLVEDLYDAIEDAE